jgi:hypothetical protein
VGRGVLPLLCFALPCGFCFATARFREWFELMPWRQEKEAADKNGINT